VGWIYCIRRNRLCFRT